MFLFGFYILSCLTVCVFGCHRSENPEPTPRFEVHNDPRADIWLGELQFVNLFCGTDFAMPSIFNRLFRRTANQQDPAELTQEELNKYKLDHSLLYYRGQAYEWGAGMFMQTFPTGTVSRNPVDCGSSITWTLLGNSTCTGDQAMQMANSYLTAFGDYALLTNNCHHFVDRLDEKLGSDQCGPF